ncbi:ADP-dependent glucokinase-like [Lytechinus variegatus]|uniref:ADP-dependent glucokinase-like n=1 Tax=Lytechinus variegatus TaxID=7654 RepID=UPI001BB20A06|nr:ADP-dependent glucokinase-like [Lytechinus variegatus]
MARNILTLGGIFSIAVIILAIIYKKRLDNELDSRLQDVLQSLLRAERKASVHPRTRVAVGFSLCSDSFAGGVELFRQLEQEAPEEKRHIDEIRTSQDLAEIFAYFFSTGAAAERYVHNRELFRKIVKLSKQQAGHWSVVGGNAAVIANRLAIEGCDVLLGGRATPSTLQEFHQHVKVVGEPAEEDDVHVILEYKTGEQFGKYISPRANRFIIHSDIHNPYLSGLEEFQEELKYFKPQVVVLGGLQMMDNFPFSEGEREARLEKQRAMILGLPSSTPVHLELASFAEEALLHQLLEYVIPYSDSLGMNEQELPNLYSLLNYGNVSLVSDAYPRVATMLDQIRSVYSILRNQPQREGLRRVTRLHVHTLAFQAILTTEGSAWKNTMSAAAKASLTAHRHVCASSEVDMAKSRLIMDDSFSVSQEDGSRKIPLDVDKPVSCWKEDDYEICVAPVLVCTQVHRTAGGGDNISSAGLSVQI